MARRRFLAQLFSLPLLGLASQSEQPRKKSLKIMMKSAWGSDDGRPFPSSMVSPCPRLVMTSRFFFLAKPPI